MNEENKKVLVVDNYDSFTYNLVHFLEAILKCKASVVKNDDYQFLESVRNADLYRKFSLIVLSPGPGHPSLDVGCVTQYILEYYLTPAHLFPVLPVLFGVCMGFEAIGAYLGIPIIKTVPRHGSKYEVIVDHVADDGTLFRNLPERMYQVRYHSLILDMERLQQCPDLILTAYSMDVFPECANRIVSCAGPLNKEGTKPWLESLSREIIQQSCISFSSSNLTRIPMAFRHRTLPIYGVQFHPESVASEYGDLLMRNVCALAGLLNEGEVNESDRVDGESSKDGQVGSPNCSESPESAMTLLCSVDEFGVFDKFSLPLAFFKKFVYSSGQSCVWLDSPSSSTGRWSFMAGERLGGRWELIINGGSQEMHALVEDIGRKKFSSNFSECPLRVPALFACLGYEFGTSRDSGQEDFLTSTLIIAERVIACDNTTGSIFALHLAGDSQWIEHLKENMQFDLSDSAIGEPSSKLANFYVSDAKPQYIEKVKACQLAIEAGESYELCLTTRICSAGIDDPVSSPHPIDPLLMYRLMRRHNPSPYGAFFSIISKTHSFQILSASPERFLRVTESGVAQMRPIKGTRPRGTTFEEDQVLVKDLATNAKDFSENLMIVDLVRNDLTKIPCVNVRCPSLMQVETYANCHQLVSTVEGSIVRSGGNVSSSGHYLVSAVESVFPAGSMTGAPKVRAMEILRAIEGRDRGLGYSGALGYISPVNLTVDLSVVIRTIFLEKGKISLGCGGAILAVSDPESEWSEMLLKARANLRVIAASLNVNGVKLFFEGKKFINLRPCGFLPKSVFTTMRMERGRIWLYERHLRRLGKSIARVDPLWWQEIKSVFDILVQQEIEEVAEVSHDGLMSENRSGPPLTSGPFDESLVETEWVDLFTSVASALNQGFYRVKVEIFFASKSVKATITPLNYTNPKSLVVSPDRCVDSADEWGRYKCADQWLDDSCSEGFVQGSVLLSNELGNVTETAIANIVYKMGDRYYTPPLSDNVLPGTVRELLVSKNLVQERSLSVKDFMCSEIDEIFCVNSVRGVFRVFLPKTNLIAVSSQL